jgi:hypothetical protein
LEFFWPELFRPSMLASILFQHAIAEASVHAVTPM